MTDKEEKMLKNMKAVKAYCQRLRKGLDREKGICQDACILQSVVGICWDCPAFWTFGEARYD